MVERAEAKGIGSGAAGWKVQARAEWATEAVSGVVMAGSARRVVAGAASKAMRGVAGAGQGEEKAIWK